MPIYEYKCMQCEEEFEVLQKISDAPLSVCKSCGGELKKLVTNTSFVLKGEGWYVTDYPSSERKKAIEAKKSASAVKDKKKGNDTKSEKKNPLKIDK